MLRALEQGLDGWEVTDVVVTMVHSGFCSVTSVAGDFRKLAPFVLTRALTEAGTEVYEPCHAFELDLPADTVSAVLSALIAAEAEIEVSEGGRRRGPCVGTSRLVLCGTSRRRFPPSPAVRRSGWRGRPGIA